MRPVCQRQVEARGKLCGQPASYRVVTSIEANAYNNRITPKVETMHVCDIHADREREYDFGTVARTKRRISPHELAEMGE